MTHHASEFSEVTRPWSTRRRAFWWVKFVGALGGGIVSVALAAHALGLNVDIQSKTAAKAEHEALRREVKDDQEQALNRIDKKIDKLSDRIDILLLALTGKRQPKDKGDK